MAFNFQFPRVKTLLHAFQAFVIFLAWAFTIAVFTRDGATDGRTAWYFALCWFTIPALIYLAAVPMWPRTRRFGNAYAFAAIDVLFSILWFSAWVAVASYVGAGKSKGESDQKDEKDEKKKKTGCDAFAYGSPGKCKLSTGTIILGVVIFLLFLTTAYMSIRNLLEYRRNGTMPFDHHSGPSDPTFAAHSKAAFSSNPAHDFDDEDAEFRSGRPNNPHNNNDDDIEDVNTHYDPHAPRRDPDDEYSLLHNNEADDLGGAYGGNANPPPSYDPTLPNPVSSPTQAGGFMHDYDTSYGGAYGAGGNAGAGSAVGGRSAASGSYHDGYGGGR
ncbi:hypothetical protein FQN50_006187 [Emmonsiellopsis sp. PD_5]|nr:hypothetical protein FQN50_006187 [Emmonsiellopsis sp. PD_5]